MEDYLKYHYSRSWNGPGHLETQDECTCAKAPCGMVLSDTWALSRGDSHCPNHDFTRTIRSSHRAEDCPALTSAI